MTVIIDGNKIFYTCTCGYRHNATAVGRISDIMIKLVHSCLGCTVQLYLEINCGHILAAEDEAARALFLKRLPRGKSIPFCQFWT